MVNNAEGGFFGQRGRRWRFWSALPRVARLANEAKGAFIEQRPLWPERLMRLMVEVLAIKAEGVLVGQNHGLLGQRRQGWTFLPQRNHLCQYTFLLAIACIVREGGLRGLVAIFSNHVYNDSSFVRTLVRLKFNRTTLFPTVYGIQLARCACKLARQTIALKQVA